MKVMRLLGSLGLGLALGLGSLRAEDGPIDGTVRQANWPWRRADQGCQSCPPPIVVTPPPQGSGSGTGSASGSPEQPNPNQPNMQDQFASAQEAGSGAGASPANMFGDIVGFVGRSSSSSSSSGSVTSIVSVGGFKIAENESPMPQDRIYVTYNFYDNVNESFNGSGTDVHREVLGFEKTLLGGDASIGMRIPFNQITGDSSSNRNQFGDLSFILKYAFIRDCQTGNGASGGLVVTAPTGKSFDTGTDSVNPWYFQPWAGFLINGDSGCYVHGFIDVAIPSDSTAPVLLSADLGVGYWIYRSNCCEDTLGGIAPTFEIHSNNPLTHRYSYGSTDSIFVQDELNLTAGAIFQCHQGSQFGIAAGVPVMGPKPWEFEILASFNLKF
jgi:hypothetical protein